MKKKSRKRAYKTGVHQSPKAGECHYRSGWELKYMLYLDENADVVTYSYEKLVIRYVSNQKTNRMRRYIPDFDVTFSDGKRLVVEIKPSNKLNRPTVMRKIRAGEMWCRDNDVEFAVLTEIDLKSMGVL
jgi:hypothetical protein